MKPKDMTGLAFLKAMKNGALPYPPIWDMMNIQIREVSEGEITFRVLADDRHTNAFGNVHGGFSETVLDAVTGCAVNTMLKEGVDLATTDINVKLIRPIPMNTELVSTGKVINLSKSFGISEGKIIDEDGKIYAHATATCFILH